MGTQKDSTTLGRKKRKPIPSIHKLNPRNALLLPPQDKSNVYTVPQNCPDVNPGTLGVEKYVLFPSGMVLVSSGTQEYTAEQQKTAQSTRIQHKINRNRSRKNTCHPDQQQHRRHLPKKNLRRSSL